MKIYWFIEKYVFSEYEDKLSKQIENLGMNSYLYDGDDEPKDLIKKHKLSEKDIVIFHSSIQDGLKVSRLPVYPGVWFTKDNYHSYKWLGMYGNDLLNSKYLMIGLNDVVRQKNILSGFGTKYLFIRPSDGMKTFPGQLINLDDLENEINTLTQCYGGIDMSTLVFISGNKDYEMENEYRFVIIDGEVISGAEYMNKENRKKWEAIWNKKCYNQEAINFAKRMVDKYQPDKAFTLDICKLSDGRYKVIEVNSFNCASLYGCDLENVVLAATNLAIDEHRDFWNL